MSRRAGPERQSLSAFQLDQHIFFLFGQIYGRRDLQLAKSLRPFGVTAAQWRVLATLNSVDACTINRLADYTVIDRTTLSRTLDRMEASGLVARRQLENDKRSFEMRLTPSGRRALERIWPVIEYHNRRAIAGLTRRELDELRRVVRKMIANVAAPPEM